MIRSWTDEAWDDYLYWQREDRRVLKRINRLLDDIARNGNEGIGNPEPLKHEFSGFWSRHIDGEHRLVYQLEEEHILVIACRYHYEK